MANLRDIRRRIKSVKNTAQIKAMKQVAGKIKGDLAQYRELAAFAQFGSDLDARTKSTLDRGARIVELFKQPQYRPILIQVQVAVLWAMQKGLFDSVPVDQVTATQNKFADFLETRKETVLDNIRTRAKIDEGIEKELGAALAEFQSFNT